MIENNDSEPPLSLNHRDGSEDSSFLCITPCRTISIDVLWSERFGMDVFLNSDDSASRDHFPTSTAIPVGSYRLSTFSSTRRAAVSVLISPSPTLIEIMFISGQRPRHLNCAFHRRGIDTDLADLMGMTGGSLSARQATVNIAVLPILLTSWS